MTGETAEPGFERVDRLAHAGEVAALDRLLDEPQPLAGDPEILVPDRDRGTDIGLADEVGAELLRRPGIAEHRTPARSWFRRRRQLDFYKMVRYASYLRHQLAAVRSPQAFDFLGEVLPIERQV
jgi:hypothetical protein